MASSKSTIDIIIGTVCKFTGIDAAKRGIKSLASSVGKNLTNIKSGFEMARAAVSKFISLISKGMDFERLTVTFKSLTGSLELAKAHMKDLQDLGRTPPFSLEAFASASQMMMKMTDGMLGYKKSLEMVGDIAAATGNDINAVARSVGLAYQMLRDGQPFGRAGSQMVQLGILTKAQVEHFDNLSKAGGDNMALWNELTQTLGKYEGAMAETEKTTKGMVEAIQGEATVAMTDFSSAISESAKPALEGLLGWMKRINEDGTIEDWADRTVKSLSAVGEIASSVGKAFGWFWKSMKTVGVFLNPFTALKAADEQGLKGEDARKFARQFQSDVIDEIWGNNTEANQEREDRKAERREAKKKKRAEAAAKLEAEAEARILEDMERAQDATIKKRADEKAKADADAAQKAVEAERKAREKMEADLHAKRIAYTKNEMAETTRLATKSQDALSSAQTEFDRAFAMYRSADHGAAAIAEERDYAADYKQLQKDASSYGGKWRIDELSSLIAAGDTKGQQAKLEEWRKSSSFTPEVESMVRAAAADNAKTTAEDELRKISANTEGLSKKLDELLSMK